LIVRDVFAGEAAVEVETFDGLLVTTPNDGRPSPSSVCGRCRTSVRPTGAHEPPPRHVETGCSWDVAHTFISSRLVKEVFSLGGEVAAFVPPAVERRLQQTREATGGGPRVVR
jgi:hypothetical protein